MKNLNIYGIETMSEDAAKANAAEHLTIKGHDVYMIDLSDHWGYSAMVYCDGQPIHYANEYALYYPHDTQEELRSRYINKLARKLYSDADLNKPLKSYDDYKRRCNYLINLYSQRRPHASAWYIGGKAPNTDGMIYDDVAFAWYDAANAEFVRMHNTLWQLTQTLWASALDDEMFLVEAFEAEMWNHEYCINWDGDAEVLAAVGFGGGFGTLTRLQRRAYAQARESYLRQCGEC